MSWGTITLVPHVLDVGTRRFWQVTGRRVDLAGPERWLDAPVSRSARVSAEWLEAEAAPHGGVLVAGEPRAGLLPFRSLSEHGSWAGRTGIVPTSGGR